MGEQLARDGRGGEEVVELQPHAGRPLHPVQLLRVLEADEHEPAVELVHAELDDPRRVGGLRHEPPL